jgi:protoporphyrin/coproporphyrin ferrochelatase
MTQKPNDNINLPVDHPEFPAARVGVLLINLGTPDATDFWSIRRYLREFLSDRRVIEVNPVLWQVILNLIILNVRPGIAGKAYREIWDAETNESPLRRYTREQADGLGARLTSAGHALDVDWAMRYGNPSIAEKLEAMKARGCRKILLLALYPQYSATTVATAYDKAFVALSKMRWQPAVRTTPAYPDEPTYIKALAKSVRTHIEGLDWEPDILLASFHGLPKRYFDAGDPYYCHCALTTRLLREELGWPEGRVRLAFQSRFGREEWLQPYIQEVVGKLPGQGLKSIAVISPGFVSDCVETLEEVAIGLRDTFLTAGGDHFTYIPCLNASDDGLATLEAVAMRELSGWLAVP